ncbi:16S rRNA (guanine(966)-N(2))-methyltransferase RsmD [Oscillospiraceae bacterium 38-13]
MRVITGSAGGRRLLELEGRETRPTTSRVKEGIFSALQFDIEGRRVLDLFAGTGQMGIECLSRGAASAVFVEARRDAAALVKQNLALTGLADRAVVVNGDARDYVVRTAEQFDLVFLDPPYASGQLEEMLGRLTAPGFDILRPYGIIVAEHPAGKSLPALPPLYRLRRTYRYGKIAVSLFRREADE